MREEERKGGLLKRVGVFFSRKTRNHPPSPLSSQFLLFNDATIQSVALLSDSGEPLADAPVAGYVRASVAAALALAPRVVTGSSLVAGAGGGALPLALAAACPHARVMAVDIDPVVLDEATATFGLPPRDVAVALARAPRGRVAVAQANATTILHTTPASLDAVFVDVATGGGDGADAGVVAAAATAVVRGGVVVVNAACPAAPSARDACVDRVAQSLAAGLHATPYILPPPPSPAEAGNVVVVSVARVPATPGRAAAARKAAASTPAATVLGLDVETLLEGLAPWVGTRGLKELRK